MPYRVYHISAIRLRPATPTSRCGTAVQKSPYTHVIVSAADAVPAACLGPARTAAAGRASRPGSAPAPEKWRRASTGWTKGAAPRSAQGQARRAAFLDRRLITPGSLLDYHTNGPGLASIQYAAALPCHALQAITTQPPGEPTTCSYYGTSTPSSGLEASCSSAARRMSTFHFRLTPASVTSSR